MSSILNDVKHTLGLLEDDDSFDIDITMHINTVIGTLNQIGVPTLLQFEVTGPEQEWESLFTDSLLNPIKSYMFLRVKLLFDPPGTGFVLASYERQITELEFRINAEVDF